MTNKPPLLSWEGIRMVIQEQDKLGQSNNMFRLEAIAQAQVDKMIEEGYKKVVEVEMPRNPCTWDKNNSLQRIRHGVYTAAQRDILKLGKLWRVKE